MSVGDVHHLSDDDVHFIEQFNSLALPPSAFDHRAHVRTATVLVLQLGAEQAYEHLKERLLAFLKHLGAPATKYHETVTYAWVALVAEALRDDDEPSANADEFMDRHPELLRKDILEDYYSSQLLKSDQARSMLTFPDIQPLPDLRQVS